MKTPTLVAVLVVLAVVLGCSPMEQHGDERGQLSDRHPATDWDAARARWCDPERPDLLPPGPEVCE